MQERNKSFNKTLKEGVELFWTPTDTVWEPLTDASKQAEAKIYKPNKEPKPKVWIVLTNRKMMYNVFKDIPEVVLANYRLIWNPTTLILDNPRNVAPNIISADKSLGIRIVKEPFFALNMEKWKPLVSTSANISGNYAHCL
jgi:L-threonylcarbamoyladenylate synthase